MKMDRLIGILNLLLQTQKTTAPELAKRFEVSRRTILRDLDTLGRAGIPIVTAQGGGGGIAIMDGYRINKSVLTAEELQNLTTALRGMDTVLKTSRSDNLMLKLAPERTAVPASEDSLVIDLASFYRDSLPEKIDCLRQGIRECTRVIFDYYSEKGETRREIEPYRIEYRWNGWYVLGWCLGREDFRRFKLNRLWGLSPTRAVFTPRTLPPEQGDGNDPFPEKEHMLLAIDKSARFRLIEAYGPDCYRETEDTLLFTFGYASREYAFEWILGFGERAEILEPTALRSEFATRVKKMGERYRT